MPNFITFVCQHCKNAFDVVPRKNKTKKFCSASCHKTHRREKSKFVANTHCLNCNSSLSAKPWNKFCCQSCAASYNNIHRDLESRAKQRTSLRHTLAQKGVARTEAKEIYKLECAFRFNIYKYPTIPGYNLLLERGMYNHHSNPTGVVRDHIISKQYGWVHQIPTEIISHPANCQFITNRDNVMKSADSHMELDDLLSRIKEWDQSGVVRHIRKTLIKSYTKAPKPKLPKKPNSTQKRCKNQRLEIYRWVLQHKSTMQIVQITSIVKWLKENKYASTVVYGKNPVWIIIEKYNLRTGERIL